MAEEHEVGAAGEGIVVVPVQKVEDSTGITEETTNGQPWRRQNLLKNVELLLPGFCCIKMPPTPTPTPRKLNFLLTRSPIDARVNASPGHSSSKGKSTVKSLLPKLSFKYRSTSDTEKAANLANGASSDMPGEKPSISRSLSLTKMFIPRMTRTSSFPVTPIAHSNVESAYLESICGPRISNRKGIQKQISRSLSVPVNNKEKIIKIMDSFFRVIPSTP